MNEKSKQSETRAFWIGIGTIVAAICLVIAFTSLIFSFSGASEEVDEQDPILTENEVETETNTESEPAEEEVKEEIEEEEAVEESQASGQTYEVKPGDTLFEIGLEFNLDWRDIVEANDLEEDTVLIPGSQLIIPGQ